LDGAVAPRLAARRQRVVGTRRQYNQWAANETLEDYALRFTAERARRWPVSRIANTALGSIAFLACEAVGATITLEFGFTNALAALISMSFVIILTGFPICYYAARYGVDMDLLTRGSGFGYIGSTVTSAIYAGFTFILFAIEAAILATALELCFGIPPAWGYVISSLVVIPIAAYGIRRIGWLQVWTQPIWLVLQIAPLIYLALNADKLEGWTTFAPAGVNGFDLAMFGAATAVLLSLLPQIGEQVDYLRFLPAKRGAGRAWWTGLTLAGPGWILLGGVKILIGSALAYMAFRAGASIDDATAPAQMYNTVFAGLVGNPAAALMLTAVFVTVCQIKINVTNAYAGSIAASNFFSRLTHRHPGRVVWLVFNILISILLMEAGIVTVVSKILALYANFAVAWVGAVTADLLINKPLGLSPKGIEFKRARLYDVNPVGLGAMAASLLVSTALSFDAAGATAQALAPLWGLATAFVAAPAIAWATRGRYYLAREDGLPPDPKGPLVCTVCDNPFERPDMAFCPVYQGPICSLCCTLEARCHDACKDSAGAVDQVGAILRRIVPAALTRGAATAVARLLGILSLGVAVLWAVLAGIYYHQVDAGFDRDSIRHTLTLVFLALFLAAAFGAWFFVLAGENQRTAEGETDRQTQMLLDEIEAHRRTDAALEKAKEAAETANLAKSRYIVGVSHEIRAPLNAISGYAQLLEQDPVNNATDAARVIRRSATHLADLVNGLLDISRIENGTLHLERSRVNLIELLNQIVDMFRLQAASKGLTFRHSWPANLPTHIHIDEKRFRQILINLLSNAIKYTDSGEAALTVTWRGQTAEFTVSDTGLGIDPEDVERIFNPFERLGSASGRPGVGLGLTITKVLTAVLGGDIRVRSTPGAGSAFTVKLFLSETPQPEARPVEARISGYHGASRRVLVTDDDPVQLELMRRFLQPLGFQLAFARDGEKAIEAAGGEPPDLVIMDIAMPGMGGWEAARRLRASLGDQVAILMVSANAHDFSRGRRPEDPHDDFLIKPYDIEDLYDRIRALLDLTWTTTERLEAAQ
jgi:signal transduction histidine kinase/ActR/RegA family two-component response regulator